MTSTAQNRKRRIRINLAAIRTRCKMLIHWWLPTRKHTLAPTLTHTIILALTLTGITGLTGRILLNDVLPRSNQVPSPPILRLTFLLCIPLARYFRTEIGHGVISSSSSGSRWYWGRYCCCLCRWCSKRCWCKRVCMQHTWRRQSHIHLRWWREWLGHGHGSQWWTCRVDLSVQLVLLIAILQLLSPRRLFK